MNVPFYPPLEVWGGIECTLNRVGDIYFDQLERNGHLNRLDDLERFAELGIRTIRYPVQWERIAPNGVERANWQWIDERLERLRTLGIKPIVGLVHHGSGPRHTSLIDASFAEGLAEFAQAVAERYPWVESYTPVNEPLTTARFSGLYGHWYPHGRDDRTFVRALLMQCRAIILAMQAIRRINPSARLVQTEDLGRAFSTPNLDYEATFENERRWLSFDLLSGRLNPDHALWNYMQRWSGGRTELEWFLDHHCPPDILGINHYLTSERFLDEHLEHYPTQYHAGNGQDVYADVDAVHAHSENPLPLGHYARLSEAWERYKLPLAITEVHLCGTREEQLRWLLEAYNATKNLRQEGVYVSAITAWSLLGAYDWNSLVTQVNNFYEPGVFDVRTSPPRRTALAGALHALALGDTPSHPVLAIPGWWRRPASDFYHHQTDNPSTFMPKKNNEWKGRVQPLVITGATSILGRAFARLCEVRGLPYHLIGRQEMDITDSTFVHTILRELEPWAVVNAAGYNSVDDAEKEPDQCFRDNAVGATVLADTCAQHHIALLTFSSDLVFDGSQAIPYVESDVVAPLCVYGRTKAVAEVQVLERYPAALVIRAGAFFGPWDAYNFLTNALQNLAAQHPVMAADDTIVSHTYVPDLVNACLDLLIDGERGIWHLANVGAITWAELATRTAVLAGIDARGIVGCPMSQIGLAAQRPKYSVLSSKRGQLLPPLDEAISRYIKEINIE